MRTVQRVPAVFKRLLVCFVNPIVKVRAVEVMADSALRPSSRMTGPPFSFLAKANIRSTFIVSCSFARVHMVKKTYSRAGKPNLAGSWATPNLGRIVIPNAGKAATFPVGQRPSTPAVTAAPVRIPKRRASPHNVRWLSGSAPA